MADDVLLNKAASIGRCVVRVKEEYAADPATFATNFSRQDAAVIGVRFQLPGFEPHFRRPGMGLQALAVRQHRGGQAQHLRTCLGHLDQAAALLEVVHAQWR